MNLCWNDLELEKDSFLSVVEFDHIAVQPSTFVNLDDSSSDLLGLSVEAGEEWAYAVVHSKFQFSHLAANSGSREYRRSVKPLSVLEVDSPNFRHRSLSDFTCAADIESSRAERVSDRASRAVVRRCRYSGLFGYITDNSAKPRTIVTRSMRYKSSWFFQDQRNQTDDTTNDFGPHTLVGVVKRIGVLGL
jgi:hypothetical protein